MVEVVELGVVEADPGTTTGASCPRSLPMSLPAPAALTLAVIAGTLGAAHPTATLADQVLSSFA